MTRDPIHIYFLENSNWSNRRELPVKFYVSTFYADGSPARCKLDVSFSEDADTPDSAKRVATVTTNRYGLAQISTPLPEKFKDEDEIGIVLSASDSSGRKGSETEELRFDNDPRVRVETDKTIYRPGEPINAVITASGDEETVVADLAGEAGLIRSERVRLRDGRASISFPYRPEFKNRVSIVVYPESGGVVEQCRDTHGSISTQRRAEC